jgi:hypothetical protein
MKQQKLTLLLLLLATGLFSQVIENDSLKILYAETDSVDRFQLIPRNALSGDNDFLIIYFDYDTIEVVEKKAIEISWPSTYIDGRYNLVISPKQIYLSSGHENPNPNFLYWINDINHEQFELIKNYLNEQNIRSLHNCTNEFSYRQSFFYNSYKKEKFATDNWTDMKYENFSRIVDLINYPLKSRNITIKIPDRKNFESIKPLRLIYGLEEIDSQVIIKIE